MVLMLEMQDVDIESQWGADGDPSCPGTTGTVTEASATPWGVTPEPNQVRKHLGEGCLRDVLMEACTRICRQCGGPVQYLMHRFEESKALQEYVDWWWKTFPVNDVAG